MQPSPSPTSVLSFRLRFVADVHLAKLARHLRMLGYDTLCRPDYGDAELLHLSENEKRILLTRDPELFEKAAPGLKHYVQATEVTAQLIEVLSAFGLVAEARSLRRFQTLCLECNSSLLPAKPHQIHERVSGDVLLQHEQFFLCPRCERVYWEGTHSQRMREWVTKTLART